MCYANQKGKCGDLIGIKGEVKEIALIKTYYMCLWNSHTRIKKNDEAI